MPSFRFFYFFAYSDKGQKVSKNETRNDVTSVCTLHNAAAYKKCTQTATPVVVLSSSRIICKICNLFSKLFTYVEEEEVCLSPKLVPCRR